MKKKQELTPEEIERRWMHCIEIILDEGEKYAEEEAEKLEITTEEYLDKLYEEKHRLSH